MYTMPPPCSTLRCQPMGTWTGTACLSSPASQSFPPFIAPPVLHTTPQRYIYHTSTSVSAKHFMFVFQCRGGGGRVEEMGGTANYASTWDKAPAKGVGGWSGRVRRAHGKPYPLSCFMATVLNGAWTSIIAASHSEPSVTLPIKTEDQECVCAVLSQESLFF